MVWTIERPNREGWYWMLSPANKDPYIRRFVEIDRRIVSEATNTDVNSSVFNDILFAGPIPVPAKP